MIQQSLGISVLLPALLMLLSAPGHFSVLPICLQKYYLCSWGEGERFYLPSLSVWGIRVSPNNKLCFQTFLRAVAIHSFFPAETVAPALWFFISAPKCQG